MDGIHYLIDEPRPFTTKYSSHKFGSKSALCYEYVLFTNKAKMAMLNGPYPAATHDRDIFKKKLKGAIEKKQEDTGHTVRVIADDGYLAKKLMHVLSCCNEMDPKEIAYFKDRALSRHEKFNGLTKVYDILTAKFRHDRGWNPFRRHPRHQACVESICVTIQYELDLGHKSLFDPYPT